MTVDQELARLRQLAENLDIQLQIRGNAELVRIDWMQNDGERGAGAKLMTAIVEFADRMGIKLYLDAWENDPWLIAYYKKFGFKAFERSDAGRAMRRDPKGNKTMTVQSRLNSFFLLTATADVDPFIGKTWTDGQGRARQVLEKITMGGNPRYVVGTGYDGKSPETDRNGELVRPDDIQNLIDRETRMWSANKVTRDRDAERQKTEDEREAARVDLDGFDAKLSPLQKGKAVAALTKMISRNGKSMSVRDVVRQCVKDGWTVEDSRHSGRILSAPDDRFLSEKQLGKIALLYAEFLIKRK